MTDPATDSEARDSEAGAGESRCCRGPDVGPGRWHCPSPSPFQSTSLGCLNTVTGTVTLRLVTRLRADSDFRRSGARVRVKEDSDIPGRRGCPPGTPQSLSLRGRELRVDPAPGPSRVTEPCPAMQPEPDAGPGDAGWRLPIPFRRRVGPGRERRAASSNLVPGHRVGPVPCGPEARPSEPESTVTSPFTGPD